MTTPFHDWQVPIPLETLKIPAFPKGVFPKVLEEFTSELARSTETPTDLSALTVLSALATATHDKYIIQIKPDYSEPVNIWTAVALPSGSRKSAVLMGAIAPIIEHEKTKLQEIEPKILEVISKNKTLEARIKELRNKTAKADSSEFEVLQKEILTLEQSIELPPNHSQLWTGDVTPENLGVMMESNNECMAILSDEAGIFDILGGKYTSGIPNLDLFLKSHSGTPARINRIGRPANLLSRPILTMGLTPQPSILKGLGQNKAFRGRGLLGRFLYAIPPSNLGQRTGDALPIHSDIRETYHGLILSILSHANEKSSLYALGLSKKAYEAWHAYSRVIEIKMNKDGPFAFMTDWAGKLPGQIARVAALLHIARHALRQPWMKEISEEDMQAAIKVGHYLSDHAVAVFDLMGADPALEGAKAILSWAQRNQLSQFTFRDCHHANKSRFKKASDMAPCIETLIENYYLKEQVQKKKPYRPSRTFIINPHLYQKDE